MNQTSSKKKSGVDPIIDCRDIHKSFGRFKALEGVSLSVDSGSILCIIGPSGSGKSTFLRILNGLEIFDRGTVIIDGIKLPGRKKDIRNIRREVGMVFQSFNLFPHMSVRENMTVAPITARGLSKQAAEDRAKTLLSRVGIIDQIDKYPEQLSGGQQQRVAIARALCMKPRVMMFDEPTSALDPENIKEVLDVIRELAHTGITMLIVTHEMRFAQEVADRIVFFDEGRVVVDTNPKDFFSRPKDERQERFLNKVL
jgi:ABC-type polar amino acid transport system ATPase subunit